MLGRLNAALPSRWFGTSSTIGAVMSGFAAMLSWLYSMYQYVQLQMRIATASGVWLDIAASDFFGTGLPRLANEFDDQYRARIRSSLFVEHGTRNAIYYTLLRLTGRAPVIFEPARPADTGAYGGAGVGAMGLAYNTAGGYGSLQMPYQALVQAYLPSTAGIPLVAGYGIPTGAYNTASRAEYTSLANAQESVAQQAIYNAVEAVRPAGTTVWVGTSP